MKAKTAAPTLTELRTMLQNLRNRAEAEGFDLQSVRVNEKTFRGLPASELSYTSQLGIQVELDDNMRRDTMSAGSWRKR